jgi:hypothetical protein
VTGELTATGVAIFLDLLETPQNQGHIVGMSEPADTYRKNADDCREQAAKAISPLDKESWLKLAQEWLAMAQSKEPKPK